MTHIRDCVVGPFKDLKQMEEVWDCFKVNVGGYSFSSSFRYHVKLLRHSFKYSPDMGVFISCSRPNMGPEEFLESFGDTQSTTVSNLEVKPIINTTDEVTLDQAHEGSLADLANFIRNNRKQVEMGIKPVWQKREEEQQKLIEKVRSQV